jgi:hypothetical protein
MGLEASPYAPLDALMWALSGQRTGSFCGDYRLFDALEFCVAGDPQLLHLCTFQNRGKHFYVQELGKPVRKSPWTTKTTTTILHVRQNLNENKSVPELVAHALEKFNPVKLPKMMFLQLLPRSSIVAECGSLVVPMDLMVHGCGSMLRMVAVGYIFGNESHFLSVVKTSSGFYIADSMNGAILERVPILAEVNNRRYNEREYKVAVMDDGSLQIGPLWEGMGYAMTAAAFAARHFEITYEEEDPQYKMEMKKFERSVRDGVHKRAFTESPILQKRQHALQRHLLRLQNIRGSRNEQDLNAKHIARLRASLK